MSVSLRAKRLWSSMDHLIWPAVCLNCQALIAPDERPLCRKCWQQLRDSTAGDYCNRCGRDVSQFAVYEHGCGFCGGESLQFDGIMRGGFYSDTLRSMILSFKAGNCDYDAALADMAAAALAAASFRERVDMLVPVPLHWTRRLQRGYNQSLLIARRLGIDVPISQDLVRIKKTIPQAQTTTGSQRLLNVKDAFAVRQGHPFEGARICLVDDIKTTGATLNECARTLKLAGAVNVYAVVLAVAGQKK